MTASPSRPPRSDAVRNRDAILEAAVDQFAQDPHANMSDIARAAGVGRVTVYGHFASREALLEATLLRAIERSEAELASIDLSGDPIAALDRLVRRSWRIVDAFHRLLGVAEETLSNERIIAHHAEPMARVRALIERGQREGAMRRDLDAAWLTSCFTALLHTAAGELRAGRLAEADADRVVAATVISLLTARAS
jgi:TetR/AcrR family transcriptional regulator, mexCD-oprJ operon repressor